MLQSGRLALKKKKRTINVPKIDETGQMIGCGVTRGAVEGVCVCVQPGRTFTALQLVALLVGAEDPLRNTHTHTQSRRRRCAAPPDSWKSQHTTAFEEKDLEIKATCGVNGGGRRDILALISA